MTNGEAVVMGEIGGVYLPGFRKIEDGRRLVYKFVDVVGRGRKANFGEPFKQGAGTLDNRPDILKLQEGREYHESQRPPREFPIYNARLLQEAHTGTLEEFFDEHGFVLLQHATKVTDWGSSEQFEQIYTKELDELVRHTLLPSRRIARIDHLNQSGHWNRSVGLRGFDTKWKHARPIYSAEAHQDTGRTPHDWLENMHAYREGALTEWAAEYLEYTANERNGGHLQLDFWRTMEMNDHPRPLTDMPLAFLDGATIELDDLVPTALVGHGATGDPSCELAVRETPKHRWCYYPNMRLDEMLVLKQFQWIPRLGDDQPYRCPLHCAFQDPSAPMGSLQQRRSNEYRCQVWLGDSAPPHCHRNKGKEELWKFSDSGIVWGGGRQTGKL